MRKKSLMALFLLTMTLTSGCAMFNSPETVEETQTVETTSEYSSIRDTAETQPSLEEEETQPSEESSDGFEKITDHKAEIQKRNLEQAKEGFAKLKSQYTWTGTDANTVFDGFINKVGMDYAELSQLSQDELYEALVNAGYSDEQIYCFSIMQWLLEAESIGDSSEPANYFTDTKAVLTANKLTFEDLIKCRNAEELNLIIQDAGLTAEELNAKLYFNSLFPGVNVDAKAILEADSTDDILDTLSKGGIDSSILKEKANAKTAESTKFADTIQTLEEEKKKEEESKSASGGSGNNNSGSNTSKDNAANKVQNGDSTLSKLPEGSDDMIVSVQLGSGDGVITGSGNYSESYSSNSKGLASVTVGDKKVTTKISVKRVVKGESAESIISASNSNLPGSFDFDNLPDDYVPVAVKFTVTTDSDDDVEGITIPRVRVRTLSGASIDTVATRVYMIQPDDEDYSGSESTKTYWIAFIIPDSQENFSLYFGDSSSETYVFKTTAIDIEGADD